MSSFSKVVDLRCGRRTNWCMKVKILRLWTVCLGSDGEGPGVRISMVLTDEDGHRIRFCVHNDFIAMFPAHLIREGKWYELEKFQVKRRNGGIHCVNSELCVHAVEGSQMKRIKKVNENLYLQIREILEVDQSDFSSNHLIDVIGIGVGVRSYTPNETDPLASRICFHISDHCGRAFMCTADGYCAQEIFEKWANRKITLPICVLRFWTISRHTGVVSLAGIDRVSDILIEPRIPEVQSFRARMAAFGGWL